MSYGYGPQDKNSDQSSECVSFSEMDGTPVGPDPCPISLCLENSARPRSKGLCQITHAHETIRAIGQLFSGWGDQDLCAAFTRYRAPASVRISYSDKVVPTVSKCPDRRSAPFTVGLLPDLAFDPGKLCTVIDTRTKPVNPPVFQDRAIPPQGASP